MVTLLFQSLTSVLTLAFGVAALLVGRHPAVVPERRREAWLLTGIACILLGASGVAQSAGAVTAFLAGEGTAAYALYVRWSPAGNHSRNLLTVVFAVVLAVQVVARGPLGPRFIRYSTVVFVAALTFGAWLGWSEGALIEARHYPIVAAFDAIQMVMLIMVLLVALWADTMDRLLWGSFAIYVVRQSLNALWWGSVAAWFQVPGSWNASPREIAIFSCLMRAAMLALAVYRLVLARRGTYVPALLEPLNRKAPSLAG